MKRKYIVILGMTAALGALSISGCGSSNKVKDQAQTESQDNADQSEDKNSEASSEEIRIDTENSADKSSAKTEAGADESAELFEELSTWNFVFSSGAGAWETDLSIAADGSFTGSYHDSDMGTTGANYPNGTVYLCDFTGKFGSVEKVNDYTYKTTIEKLESKEKEGKEEISDGMKFVYSTPYGLSDAEDIYIYMKGAPSDKLPQEYQEWVMFPLDGAKTLPFYGLYNEKEQLGFYSWDASDLEDLASGITEDTDLGAGTDSKGTTAAQTAAGSDVMEGLVDTLNKADTLEKRLQTENLTQEEMNELSDELYKVWDAQLNTTWKQLKRTLDADTMETLTKKQREWIKERDKKIQEAGEGYEGGSIQTMLMNMEGADQTKSRCYELFEYLR